MLIIRKIFCKVKCTVCLLEQVQKYSNTILAQCIFLAATRETISLCEKMAKAGAKALLIVTPCFYKGAMTSEALISHYTKVGIG